MERLEWAVEAAVAGGVNLVQLREKDIDPQALLAVAERLRHITHGKALLFVNAQSAGQVEIALASDADGVHLGEVSLPVEDVRRLLAGRDMLIGQSVHGLAKARQAEKAGVDLVQVGTVFASASHPGQSPTGTELISLVASSVTTPVFGVGGITTSNAHTVIAAGADGVAVVREVLAAQSPYRAAQRLRQAVDQAYAARSSTPGQEAVAP
jgi:thiamine-phosphate pyrophosphorylase